VFSRYVVGWTIAYRESAELVTRQLAIRVDCFVGENMRPSEIRLGLQRILLENTLAKGRWKNVNPCGAVPWKSGRCGSLLCRTLPLFLLTSHSIFALDSDRTIAQFHHTGWPTADGTPRRIRELAQTTDGYLWLSTSRGLFRFDGVRFQRYEPGRGDRLPFQDIRALFATPDGGLWIGLEGGTAFLKNGRARSYAAREGLPRAEVLEFALDREGTVWAATNTGLFRFEQEHWNKIGAEWGFSAKSARGIFVDNQGKLWVNGGTDLFCLPPGAHIFQTRKVPNLWIMRQTRDGTFWMLERNKSIPAVFGQTAQFYDRSKPTLELSAGRFLVARSLVRRYEMLSATHRRATSKRTSAITEARSRCASGMMERASIREWWQRDAPATTGCLGCANAQSASVGS
jgi:ligand-binding sensor domain-containing protein